MAVALSLVINPAAGDGKPAAYLPRVTTVLDAAGTPYTVQESTSLEHAKALARAAARRGETVVAFGGDGLTGALAGVVAQEATAPATAAPARHSPSPAHQATSPPAAGEHRGGAFGIIPAGRGNDFARTMRIPFDPAAAARVLVSGRPRPVDLIAVTGAAVRPTSAPVMVAGSVYVGIASVASEIANRTRLIRGPAVYNLAAVRALLGWKHTTFGVEATSADGTPTRTEFPGYAVVVANSAYFGAGMKVAPHARTEDGLLDIVVMRHAPRLTFARALMKVKDGSHLSLSQVSAFRARAATVTVSRPMPAGADGELLPTGSPLTMRAVPAAVEVITPA